MPVVRAVRRAVSAPAAVPAAAAVVRGVVRKKRLALVCRDVGALVVAGGLGAAALPTIADRAVTQVAGQAVEAASMDFGAIGSGVAPSAARGAAGEPVMLAFLEPAGPLLISPDLLLVPGGGGGPGGPAPGPDAPLPVPTPTEPVPSPTLTEVPEPAAFALFALALLGMLALRARRLSGAGR
jgi:hypothetical protein